MAAQRTIWWGSGSAPAWRVLIGLKEKGLEYDSKLIEFSKKEHKSEDILRLNPRGQVPTFLDDGVVVNESLAALLYLQDKYPEPSLLPATIEGRALVYQRFQEAANFHDKVSQVIRFKWTNADEALPQDKLDALQAELELWESYLSEDSFIAGPDFTLADISFGPFLLVFKRFGGTLKDFPKLNKYAEKIEARPSFEDSYPPHWKETPGKDWLDSL
ncbi:glutathione S-transferase [Coccomyxa subellipsoidea C-169]|uniref:Glutathione S-transferase n=1 Tax=Coccomyxa subellipsoidea (strain C-169) TaxID=574566 RepID=I0YKW9_COCSC|nr:glutathione S-transferase [Coccomyxa subellipsoidea C-169]EIE19038.1 glutathione S-transferase [Coccomyxa subellipsoidea C-169]|eukprot:XP_005643582.1 glutathione S-transferase [Coccomyxa subellipsoidea C-169]